MCLLSVSGPDSHWGVSRYLEFPWLLEAKAETARLMRVFMDAPPHELLANRGEFYAIVNALWIAVTETPCCGQ